MRVTTANVLKDLDRADARACLDLVLEGAPDLIGLQEWRLHRAPLLLSSGAVTVAGARHPRVGRGSYTWVVAALGDCVLGLGPRFRVERTFVRRLGGVQVPDAGAGLAPVVPPRWVTCVEAFDLEAGHLVGAASFHLQSGVQRHGAYRNDRPVVVARHRQEVRRLQDCADELLGRCRHVFVMGDSNVHGLALRGLESAWTNHPGDEGTLGRSRRVDDVFATVRATEVRLATTASDHRAVQVDFRLGPA